MGDPHDGVAGVYATLRAEEAWAVHEVLDCTARAMRQQGDPRDLDTLRAGLFVEWVTGTTTAPAEAAAPPPGGAATAGSRGRGPTHHRR